MLAVGGPGCKGLQAAGTTAPGNALPTQTLTPGVSLPMDLLRILIAILLPPLGVFLQVGFRGAFWLNILLTLLGYVPGIIHAVWIIARR